MFKISPRSAASLSYGTALLMVTCLMVPVNAQESSSQASAVPGRIEFDFADAPPASVEVDLKHGMLSAVTGIAKAAVQGVTEALLEFHDGHSSPAVQQSAEHLEAVDAILDLVGDVIHEVRVRVYEGLSEQTPPVHASMLGHYQDKLHGSKWETVVRVRDDDDSVIVCVLEEQATIRGIFVMVADEDNVVVANVVCQLTPDNIKQLTKKATTIGMKFGLGEVIEEAMREISR